MKRIKMFIASLALLLSVGSLAVPALASAASPKAEVCSTLGGGNDCKSQPANGISLNKIVTVVLQLFSAVIGVVAVIMVMISGFKYVTSGGDSSKTAGAKNTLIYAVVGIAIAAFAQAIVLFVLAKLK